MSRPGRACRRKGDQLYGWPEGRRIGQLRGDTVFGADGNYVGRYSGGFRSGDVFRPRPAWYRDPGRQFGYRWWDDRGWTTHVGDKDERGWHPALRRFEPTWDPPDPGAWNENPYDSPAPPPHDAVFTIDSERLKRYPAPPARRTDLTPAPTARSAPQSNPSPAYSQRRRGHTANGGSIVGTVVRLTVLAIAIGWANHHLSTGYFAGGYYCDAANVQPVATDSFDKQQTCKDEAHNRKLEALFIGLGAFGMACALSYAGWRQDHADDPG